MLALMGSMAGASPIQYEQTMTATGTLNGSAFTSAIVEFIVSGDTSSVTFNSGDYNSSATSTETATITGQGTVTVTDTGPYAFCNPTSGIVGISDGVVGDYLDFSNPGFIGYHMATPIGPFSSGGGFTSLGENISTSGGTLHLTSTTGTESFQATPEPATPALLFGIGSLALLRRRRPLQ